MKIRFLGTGTSTGVPEVGCRCEVCTSGDVRDRRLRTSVLVEGYGLRVLLDCGPDFRQQMLGVPFERIDAVLLTHEHYDHTGGIDDLRPFCRFGEVGIYAEGNVCEAIRRRLPYCFADERYPGSPRIGLNVVDVARGFAVRGVEVMPIRVWHGRLPIVGYRIGGMAYLTDVSAIPDDQLWKLRGVDTLIISALRREAHPSHETVEEALRNVERVAPRCAYLIHASHGIGRHVDVERGLPAGVWMAYDGLCIEVEE